MERSEVRRQRSEVRGQKSEVRSQRSEGGEFGLIADGRGPRAKKCSPIEGQESLFARAEMTFARGGLNGRLEIQGFLRAKKIRKFGFSLFGLPLPARAEMTCHGLQAVGVDGGF